MERYFAAKETLFTSEHAQRAVVWVDDDYGARLAARTTVPVVEVRRGDATAVVSTLLGSTFFWRGHLVRSPLLGDYNVDNALIALSVIAALGASEEAAADALAEVHAVPGRFELVASDGVVVIVDYAHTPAGLERLIGDVRALAGTGRVLVVIGCGGDRDQEKRPVMGRVASTMADVTVVTSDNPRGEDPDTIIDAVVAGAVAGADVRREADRRRAIALALETAGPGDVVVVAGKGHETTQTFSDRVVDFDDRAVVRELLR
jgi:UDP-N-acetylmuramoyl-L-alanyl-D-glutamate--2,6-diaminopimelate ligase